MCIAKLVVVSVALSVATACVPNDSPQRTLVSESYSFSDPAQQKRLEQALSAAGVPFTIEMHGGQEHIRWEAKDASRANAVRIAVMGADLPRGRHVAYGAEEQAKFKEWLTQNGIPYSTMQNGGREYVVWEKEVDDKVRQWPLPLPPK